MFLECTRRVGIAPVHVALAWRVHPRLPPAGARGAPRSEQSSTTGILAWARGPNERMHAWRVARAASHNTSYAPGAAGARAG